MQQSSKSQEIFIYGDKEAIRLTRNNAYFHNEYGKMLFTLQQYGEALGEYYKALKLNPNFTQVYQNLSEVYTELAKQAQEEYTRRKNNGG
jgi:tetratricopeptide (TPR) repeat protein